MIRLGHVLLPCLAQHYGNIREMHVAPEDLALLEPLRPTRCLLAPNHPRGCDPLVLFWLSRCYGQNFNYMAAREILDGFLGWVMNRVGTYSVIRGVPDRDAIRMTRCLLAEQDRKVVIFPEGEIYEHNDHLLAFQTGVAQMGFWALDDLRKLGKPLSLPIVPIAIKYRCCDAPRPAIEKSLLLLEEALRLDPAPRQSAYQRLRRIGDRVLQSLEIEAGLSARPGEDLNERIDSVRQRVLENVARCVGVPLNRSQAPADQLHLLFHALKEWIDVISPDRSPYDALLFRRRLEAAMPLFRQLQRLQNFIAVTGDYVAAEATAERFLDVLGRLEKEVLGEVHSRVPREAYVRIALPIRLEERYEAYRQDKKETVRAVTAEMESAIREMLREMSRSATPLALDV